MATWPSIPPWLVGVALRVEPVLRSGGDGYPSQRVGAQRNNDRMQAQLLLTESEFSTFETFVQTTLNQGADEFTGPYFDGAGYRTGAMMLIDGAYSPTWDGSFFTVDAELLIINRTDPDPDLMALLYGAGIPLDDWAGLLQALEDCVNLNNL